MPREHTYLAIILKKQPFGDADELVTIFTQEAGKLRAVAKSVKLPKSKLQHAIQVPFLVRLRLADGQLPKVIGAEVQNSFGHIRHSLESLAAAFYVLELILKFTADEHPSAKLFKLAKDFLEFLDRIPAKAGAGLLLAIVKFQIRFLDAVGLSISAPAKAGARELYFSNSHGGFTANSGAAVPATAGAYELYQKLTQGQAGAPDFRPDAAAAAELRALLSQFLEYHLERRVKSERFLKQSGVV